MVHLIDKDALVAWAKETYLCENASMVRKVCYKQLLEHLDTLEVKEVDLEKDVRQIIDLYLEAGKHYDDVIKKERDTCGYSDLAIKLLDRTADAKEMSIQYVLDKLKAQKGEEV